MSEEPLSSKWAILTPSLLVHLRYCLSVSQSAGAICRFIQIGETTTPSLLAHRMSSVSLSVSQLAFRSVSLVKQGISGGCHEAPDICCLRDPVCIDVVLYIARCDCRLMLLRISCCLCVSQSTSLNAFAIRT